MARLLQHTLTAALLAALVCGCSSDDVAGGGVPSDETQISFILKLDGAQGRTRAAWSDGYDSEDSTPYDERINPDDLKVALYNTDDNTLAANVNILSYQKTNTDDNYIFIGLVKAAGEVSLSQGKYKLMVFANCGDIDLNHPSADLDKLYYTYNEADVKAGTQLIPMWGVTTPWLSLEKGKRDNAGQIELLRAFAKVEINLHSDISGTYQITSAKLNNYNTQGFCLPAGYAGVGKTVDLDQEDGENPSFNPYHSPSQTALDFDYSKDRDSAYLYIPEYRNSDAEATISLTLSDGKTETIGTLEFKEYENGVAVGSVSDIVRNHIYRYTVNVNQGKLVVKAKVLPWELVNSSIGWMANPASTTANPFTGTTIPENTYILLPVADFDKDDQDKNTVIKLFKYLYANANQGDDDARYCILTKPTYVDGAHKILKTGTAGARYFFLFNGPAGATWEAHLTNTEDFTFSYSSSSDFGGSDYSGDVYMVSHGIAREKPYIIQVNARKSYTGIDEKAETAENGNIKEGENYPWYLDEDYWDEKNKSRIDKIDDTSKDSWWTDSSRKKFYNEYDNGDDSKLKESFTWLTDWGKEQWYGQKVVDTEFYITVKLADGTEYELTINPSYDKDAVSGTLYNDNRRYAGTDTRIWIRQVRAMYGWGYDDLAKDVNPSAGTGTGEDDFAWWRVNPYWKK